MMSGFTACLFGVGAVLSLVARLPALGALVGLTLVAGLVLWALVPEAIAPDSIPVATVLGVVGLQAGYACGVFARAGVLHLRARRRTGTTENRRLP